MADILEVFGINNGDNTVTATAPTEGQTTVEATPSAPVETDITKIAPSSEPVPTFKVESPVLENYTPQEQPKPVKATKVAKPVKEVQKTGEQLMAEEAIQAEKDRPSTFLDYMDVNTPMAIELRRPSLSLTSEDVDSGFDRNDTEFQEYFKKADSRVKAEMNKADSTNAAIKIAKRNQIRIDGEEKIAKDSIAVQMLYAGGASLLTPSSLIPATAGLKVAKILSSTSKIVNGAKMGAVVGATAGVGAIIDEATFGARGYSTDYSSAVIAAGFGGTLGFGIGVLAGTVAKAAAKTMHPVQDRFQSDMKQDLHHSYNEDGSVNIHPNFDNVEDISGDSFNIVVDSLTAKFVAGATKDKADLTAIKAEFATKEREKDVTAKTTTQKIDEEIEAIEQQRSELMVKESANVVEGEEFKLSYADNQAISKLNEKISYLTSKKIASIKDVKILQDKLDIANKAKSDLMIYEASRAVEGEEFKLSKGASRKNRELENEINMLEKKLEKTNDVDVQLDAVKKQLSEIENQEHTGYKLSKSAAKKNREMDTKIKDLNQRKIDLKETARIRKLEGSKNPRFLKLIDNIEKASVNAETKGLTPEEVIVIKESIAEVARVNAIAHNTRMIQEPLSHQEMADAVLRSITDKTSIKAEAEYAVHQKAYTEGQTIGAGAEYSEFLIDKTPENKGMIMGWLKDNNMVIGDIGRMADSLMDKMPFLGDLLKSDISTGFQSKFALLRSFTAKISSPTVSIKDSAGRLVASENNGMDKKTMLQGHYNNLSKNITREFIIAKEEGFIGNQEEFMDIVYKGFREAVSQQEVDMYHYKNKQLEGRTDVPDEEIQKILDDYLTENKPKFDDTPQGRSQQHVKKYFDGIQADGKKSLVKEFYGIHPNKLYLPRSWDIGKVVDGKMVKADAQKQIENAIIAHPGNKGLSNAQATEAAKKILDDMLLRDFNSNFKKDAWSAAPTLRFGTNLNARKILVDERELSGLLVDGITENIGAYNFKITGRIAFKHAFGTDSPGEVMEMLRKADTNNEITIKEYKAFERSMKDLNNELRLAELSGEPLWAFTRNLNTYNTVRFMGGAGFNQVIELMSAVMYTGISSILRGNVGRSFKSAFDAVHMNGEGSEFSRYLLNADICKSALATPRANAMADNMPGYKEGFFAKWLNKGADKLMKYNGMKLMLQASEELIAGAIVTKVKLGKVTDIELSRWGLSRSSYDNLQADIVKNLDEEGGRFDVSQMSEVNQTRLQLAIRRGVEEIIIQADSIHIPSWGKEATKINKIIFQFMKFPLIAQEVLLRKGFSEERANLAASIIGGSMMYILGKYMREKSSVALGFRDEEDNRYDVFDNPEHLQRALLESVNYMGGLGMTTSLVNYGAIIAGRPEIGKDWTTGQVSEVFGASANIPTDVYKIIAGVMNGDATSEKELKLIKQYIPFLSVPILSEGVSALAEEIGD